MFGSPSLNPRSEAPPPALRTLPHGLAKRICALAAFMMASCEGGASLPASVPQCGPPGTRYLDRLPIDESDLRSVSLLGQMFPPVDPIPEGQSGLRYSDESARVAIVAPGASVVTGIESSHFAVSPGRQGHTDYSITLHLCREVYVVIGHINELATPLAAAFARATPRCEVSEGVEETIENCSVRGLDLPLESGADIGVGGEGFASGLDFDPYDLRAEPEFANPDRFPMSHLTAICMHGLFEPDLEAFLNENTFFNDERRTGDPLCGTHAVDVPGTAQGVWVREGAAVDQNSSSESAVHLLTLAPHFVTPDAAQMISPGMGELGATLWEVGADGLGRVDVPFSQIVGNDGVYCYAATNDDTRSFYVALSAEQTLRVEMRTHGIGDSPCLSAPESWIFSSESVAFVR